MKGTVAIRVRDLRRYLDGFSEDAVVLRDIGDAAVQGAYVDLGLAMTHLEQEADRVDDPGEDDIDGDVPEDGLDSDDEDRFESDLLEERERTMEHERSIAAWERAQN